MINPIKTNDFEAIKLKLASPENILTWSYGEVTRPETINYRTQKPEKDGLFCERIFGPSKDWECYCGKYKKIRYRGIICDKCGVEVTRSLVRRERFGHIKLETPVTHIWFLRGLSSKIGLALDLSMQALEKVVYFASFIITDVNEELKQATLDQIKAEYKAKKKSLDAEFAEHSNRLKSQKTKMSKEGKSQLEITDTIEQEIKLIEKSKDEKQAALDNAFFQAQKELKDLKPLAIISENAYQNLSLKYGHIFTAGIGAEAIRSLLEKLDMGKEIKQIEKSLIDAVESKKDKLIKRLKFFKNLKTNNINPSWMVLSVVPVIPPDLRPMVALDGGRFATSDLNDLYRRIINRNNRLKQLLELNAPEVICRNEKRMLQEAVDALIDNSIRHGKTVVASTGQKRMLKSLADSLKGKQGRFRQNLLGKRIDYSGRSVIVVNPNLKLNQCGLPKRMAIELFKPFIISKLIQREIVHNVRSASRYIEAGHDEVWDILEEIIKGAFVMLNRAPTLHRLGIQAFKPTLIEGLALQIHPLVCTAFNADFDGDQMAVHVPLTEEAIAEARDIMLSSHNLLKPATGDPVVSPDKDIVWGSFYMSTLENDEQEIKKYFYSPLEARAAYELGRIALREKICVVINGKRIETSIGRITFNDLLPEKLQFVNDVVGKGKVKSLVKECLRLYGEERTVQLLDDMKKVAFDYITRSGLSWGMDDLPNFEKIESMIETAEKQAEEIQSYYDEGLLTDSERYAKIIELWTKVKEEVTAICTTQLDKKGPVFSMIESGARGSWAQLTQILGMKGLVTSPSGKIIELPVKGNFKHGFDVLEYFIATHGVRKGLSDTALRTSNAGYLTRRLVDVAQDVVVASEDCGAKTGLLMTKEESEEMGRPLIRRITGRFLTQDLKNAAGKVLVKKGELITEDIADQCAKEEIMEAEVRSILHCELHRGVCQKCYGYDLAYNKLVRLGTAVGIIAAQSIGEPGTQLTMRTFHTGGVADQDDITQGLPRVEEIFEARSPKRKAFIADVAGTVKISELKAEGGTSQGKVVTILYDGEETDKYYFTEATMSTKAKKAESDKEAKPKTRAKKPKVEVLVSDGDKVKKDTPLFKAGEAVVKAARGGKVKLEEKYVKVIAEVEKAREFAVPRTFNVWVKDGATVKIGDQLTDGSLDLQQLYELRGIGETQKYIVKEIQYVYSSQGQPLNDKHIETISRQMFSRVYIVDPGETDFLIGEVVEKSVFDRDNALAKEAGKKPALGRQLLMGMTKASLSTNSFLSAASFQETAKVLIEAAITGKVDHLEGLKENVIIGRPIPAGTGFKTEEDEEAEA